MTLGEAITARHKGRHAEVTAALQADPALLQAARADIERLADTSGPRNLIEHDHISRERHRALVAMLATL